MRYLNNFCSNLNVINGKSKWQKENLKNIVETQDKIIDFKQRLDDSIKNSLDNNKSDINGIQQIGNSQINDIENVLHKLCNGAKCNKWQVIINQLKQLKSFTKDGIANYQWGLNRSMDEATMSQNIKKNPLSQVDILAFCGKLLDILKNGDIPFQTQSDKYEYLKQYFEVKSNIAKIQNILLVREILHREDNKNKDNEQKIQKQKEELELVINANYLAFQSSVKEQQQLKKEIENIKSQLKNTTNNDAIDENNINNNTYDINEDDIIAKLRDIESKISTNKFEQKESTLRNNNIQFLEDVDKKTLEIQKHLLTKQLELCFLYNGIKQQIDNFIDVFFCIEKEEQLNEFEIEKKGTQKDINSIGAEYLSKMQNVIMEYKVIDHKDFYTYEKKATNILGKIPNIKNDIDNDDAKPHTTSTETSCIDSLCCRICAEEPITYTSKNINSRENIGNILTKFKPSKSITISNIDGKNDFNKNISNNKKNNNLLYKGNNYENSSLNNYQLSKDNINILNNKDSLCQFNNNNKDGSDYIKGSMLKFNNNIPDDDKKKSEKNSSDEISSDTF